MEETPEGLAAAKATRELAKEAAKHAQQPPLKRAAEGASGPASKKPAKDKVANKCTHEVTLPDNYNESANALDPNIHGMLMVALLMVHHITAHPPHTSPRHHS